jgi:hypothetical protein
MYRKARYAFPPVAPRAYDVVRLWTLRVDDAVRRVGGSSLPSLRLLCIPLQLYRACFYQPKELAASEASYVVITYIMYVDIMARGGCREVGWRWKCNDLWEM